MRLLVSVADVDEARMALAAGSDIIDAKNPRRGSLGPVSSATLRAIVAAVRPHRPVSAALGDALSTDDVRRHTMAAATAGAAFVKLGFRRVATVARAYRLATQAFEWCTDFPATALVLVAYADAARAGSLAPTALVDVAARVGAGGVLLDTCAKDAGGLFDVLPRDAVYAWVAAAHECGLHAGLAGSIGAREIVVAAESGADLVGVRGAACDGGRNGRLSAARIARLLAALGPAPRPAAARA